MLVRVSVDNAPRTERRSAAKIKMHDWGLLRDRSIKLISVNQCSPSVFIWD